MEKFKEFNESRGGYNRLWCRVIDELLGNDRVIVDYCWYGEIKGIKFRCSYGEW